MSKNRWTSIAAASLAGAVLIAGLLTLLSAQTSAQASAPEAASAIEHLASTAEDPAPLGEPCGSGEQMDPWVICLHGTVSVPDSFEPGRVAIHAGLVDADTGAARVRFAVEESDADGWVPVGEIELT